MTEKSDSQLRAIAKLFRLTGWITFWAQLVLGVISGGILLFASISPRTGNAANPGAGLGVFFAISGLVALAVGIFIAFRYVRIGRQLDSANSNNRPRKLETVQVVRLGLIVHLVGILLTLVGAQAIVGILLTKALTLPQFTGGVYTQLDPSRVIQPLDIFVVQANTNTVSAHFAGLIGSIWLLNRITK
jgi:amino acid transporter